MNWKFQNTAGKAYGTQGWEANHEKASCIVHTGLWRGNKVVALLVAKGEYDEIGPALTETGKFIVKACNAHDPLVKAMEAAFIAFGKAGGNTINGPFRTEWEAARDALKTAGV